MEIKQWGSRWKTRRSGERWDADRRQGGVEKDEDVFAREKGLTSVNITDLKPRIILMVSTEAS